MPEAFDRTYKDVLTACPPRLDKKVLQAAWRHLERARGRAREGELTTQARAAAGSVSFVIH